VDYGGNCGAWAAVPGVGMGWFLSKIQVATVAHLAAKVIQHFDIYFASCCGQK